MAKLMFDIASINVKTNTITFTARFIAFHLLFS